MLATFTKSSLTQQQKLYKSSNLCIRSKAVSVVVNKLETKKSDLGRKKKTTQRNSKSTTKFGEKDNDVRIVESKEKRSQKFKDLGHIYDNPQIYDMAFQFRNIEAETDFLYDAAEFILGRQPKTYLELGCGPAQHCMEMKDSELEVYALDSNSQMLDHAKNVAAEFGLKDIHFINADMCSFELPGDKKVEVIGILNNTICELVDPLDVSLCFRHAKDALVEDGLIFIDMTHPGQYFDGSILTQSYQWNMDFEDGSQLDGAMASDTETFDPITQIVERTVQISVNQKGKLSQINCKVPQRLYTYGEIELLADKEGLQVVDFYDEMSPTSVEERKGNLQQDGEDEVSDDDDDQALQNGDEDEEDEGLLRMVMILQKKKKEQVYQGALENS